MRLVISEDCITCGLCMSLCSELFFMDEDRKIRLTADEVPKRLQESAEEAMDSCPVQAIRECLQ